LNNATNAQCWQKPTNLATSADNVAKNYCGFAVVAGERLHAIEQN
jgi:hypothetical protein